MFRRINAYELGRDRKKDFSLLLLAFALLFLYGTAWHIFFGGWYAADSYVTTLLAFSYLDNGFLRRGLVGTLFSLVCRLIPAAGSAHGAVWFMWGMNIIYFASLLLFIRWIFRRIKDEAVFRGAFFFTLICLAFMIPTACYHQGAFGRADLMQMALCLLQVYLLVEMKYEWLTVPLTAVNVLFHEGYVLMTFCAVLIVLLYRALYTEGKRGKYWVLFALNVAVCGAVAVLSLKGGDYSHAAEHFAASSALAQQLNENGLVHYNLLYMMAGYAPENAPVIDDASFVAAELQELPVFLVFFIPAFLVFGRGLVNLFRKADGKRIGLHIVAVLLGPALIGVEYVKYCDYGRYILWLVFYFFVMLLSFAVMGDEGARKSLSASFGYKNLTGLLIFAVMILYQPLPTCSFTEISYKLSVLLHK